MSREAVQRALIEDSLFREPLWHGSNRSLAELLPDAPGHSEYGIYLTPRRRYAKQYGKHLYAVRAHVTNPLVVEGKYEISPGDLRHSDIERLKSRGYDAVVVGSLHDASEYGKILHGYADRSSIRDSDEVTPASAAFNRARYALRHFDDLGPETLVRSLGDLWREGGGTCVRKDIAEEALVNQVMIGTPGRPKIEAAKLLSATCGTLTPAGGRVALHGAGAFAGLLHEDHEYKPTGAKLKQIDLTGHDLSGAKLTGANMAFAELIGVNLSGAHLSRANLNRADLTGANLTGANLTGATLVDAYLNGADLTGANLTGAALISAGLNDANLTEANLAGADLTGAYLAYTKLARANLKCAVLSDTRLIDVDLSGANLTGASLTRAALAGVDFSGAYLSGVDLTGAWRKASDADIPGWRRNASGRLEKDGT